MHRCVCTSLGYVAVYTCIIYIVHEEFHMHSIIRCVIHGTYIYIYLTDSACTIYATILHQGFLYVNMVLALWCVSAHAFIQRGKIILRTFLHICGLYICELYVGVRR